MLDRYPINSGSSVAQAIELATANIDNPTELNALGTAVEDLRLVHENVAASDRATLYRLDTSSDSVSAPWIMASATAGLRWVAIAGYARNQPIHAASLKEIGTGAQPVGGESVGIWSNWSGSSGVCRAIQGYLAYTGNSSCTAYDASITQTGNTGFGHIIAYQGDCSIVSGSATATFLAGEWITGSHNGSGLVTTAYGYYFGGWTGTGTITNKWAFFNAGVDPSYTGGDWYVNKKLSVGTGVAGQTATFNAASGAIVEWQSGGTTVGYIANGSNLFSGYAATDFAIDANASAKKVVLGNAGTPCFYVVDSATISIKSRGAGVAATVTSASTQTLSRTSTEIQTYTGSTVGQVIQFPAANLFGAGVAVLFTINNQSSVTVTPTRAGADTFQGGGTTDPVVAGATTRYASDGSALWMKV